MLLEGYMKKTILAIVILSLLLSVCSCASSNSKEVESLNQKISELEKQTESSDKSTTAATTVSVETSNQESTAVATTVPAETSNQDGGTYLAAVIDDGIGGAGYIDETGDYVIKPQFGMHGDFAENGFAVDQDSVTSKLWGYIDKKGDYGSEPQFGGCGDFAEN